MGSRSVVGGVLALGVVVVLGGCDSSVDGDAGPAGSTTATVAADVPAGFDPCEDIPQSVLDSERLRQKIPDNSAASGGIKWRGCLWGQPDGYAVSIQTTNITVEMVRAKGFVGAYEFVVSGREAVASRQSEVEKEASCTVNVAMRGGSLSVGLTNPTSAKNTGHLDSCDLARQVAEKVVPALPAGA